jgi:hypothetical protein
MRVPAVVVLEVFVQALFLLPKLVIQSPWVVAEAVALLLEQEAILEPKEVILFSPQSPQLVVDRVLVVTRVQDNQVAPVQVAAAVAAALMRLVELETKEVFPR